MQSIKKKIYAFTVTFILLLLFALWTGGYLAAAKTPAPVSQVSEYPDAPDPSEKPKPQKTDLPEETKEPVKTKEPEETKSPKETKEPEETKSPEETKLPQPTEPAEYSLYIGQKSSLPMPEKGKLTVQDPSIVKLTAAGELHAIAAGNTSILLTVGEKTEVYCRVRVKTNELLAGIEFNEQSFPPCPVGAKGFSVQQEVWKTMSCKWSSLDSHIAKVDDKGFVTPVADGTTWICVQVTDVYGGVYTYLIPVTILNPRFDETSLCLAKGLEVELKLSGCKDVPVQVTSSDTSVLRVLSITQDEIEIETRAKGKATIHAVLDGVERTCEITVTAPKLNKVYGFYQKAKGFRLKVTGTKERSQVSWRSSDTRVATVSNNGYVKTKKKGSAVIICVADQLEISFYLAVSGKTAVKAMRHGFSKVGKRHYSQARRMSKYYYDCSSFVYRCYRAAGKYLVRKTSWAPVAAEIGQYYVRKGKYVKGSGTYKPSKLLPGDLICWGGKTARANGRYKRIYHISLYIGNGKTMESSSTYNNVVIRDRDPFKKLYVPVIARPC